MAQPVNKSPASLERRIARWYRRTVWYLGEFWRELGFGQSGRAPLWLRDNPFLARAIRQSARGPAVFVQSALLICALVTVLYLSATLDAAAHRQFNFAAHFIFNMTSRGLVVALVVCTHWFLIIFTWMAQLSRVAQDQRRRHWLAVLTTVPAHRSELVLADAVASSLRRLLVHCTTLPLYVLMWQVGGLPWPTLFCLLGLFVFADFTILPLPPPPMTLTGKLRSIFVSGMRARVKQLAVDQVPATFIGIFVVMIVLSEIPGLAGSAWTSHLLGPLHLRPPFEMTRSMLLFPLFAASTISEGVEFFRGTIPPWLYVFPGLLMLRVAAAIEVGSRMNTLEGGVEEDGGAARRARVAVAFCSYALLFTIIGYAWQACIVSGDTAMVFGPATAVLGTRHTHALAVAGLLVLLGIAVPPIALVRALSIRTHTRSGVPRRAPGMAVRYAVTAARSACPLLAVYLLVNVCGLANPLPREALSPLLRLAATTAVTVTFAAGARRFVTGFVHALRPQSPTFVAISPVQIAFGGAIAVGALLLPISFGGVLAAWLPYYAWFDMLPMHGHIVEACIKLAASSEVRMSRPPADIVCLLAPAFAGFALWISAPVRRAAQPAAAPARVARAATRHRAGAAPTVLASRIDNPVFLRDFARSLPKLPIHPLIVLGALLLVAAAFTWYQAKVEGYSFYISMGIAQGTLDDPVALWAITAAIPLMITGFIALGLAGYWAGERILVEEFEQGSLGALLICPLKDAQIIVARIVARILGSLVGPAAMTLVGAALVAVAIKNPANTVFASVWFAVTVGSVAVFLWSIAGGLAISVIVMRLRWLRGASVIAGFAGPPLLMWLTWYVFPDLANTPSNDLLYTIIGIVITGSAVVCLLSIGFAYYQFVKLRRGDIAYGDQPGS